MKYLGIYIKDRKMYFLLTAFICGVTAVINYLYSAPLQAGLYAFEISLTVLVIVCAADCGCGFVVTGDGRKSAGSGGTGY